MSDTDSFIEEVTEEVRRDRLYALLKRYGWIAVLAILLIVGGAAFNEYRKSQARASAERLGDDIMAALAPDAAADRAAALEEIATDSPGGQAIVRMLTAAAQTEAGDRASAVAQLEAVASDGELPAIYRQIATFKALTLQADSLDEPALRQGFEALAAPGAPLRLLAEEQLAMLDISSGDADAAIGRLNAILQDAEATPDLQQRAVQVIVALGGTPEIPGAAQG